MSDEPGALSLRTSPPTEADYEKICNAVMETERGRWFLIEYARRNRNADTSLVLAAIDRIEATLRFQKAAALASPQPLSALQPELEDLKSIIVRTRENLAAIKPDTGFAGKPAEFSDIAQALERLSLQIRGAAERMQEAGWTAPDGRSDDFDGHAADISAFCMSIEKIAAESHNVAMLLRTIEDRIDLFLSHAGAPEKSAPEPVARANDAHAAAPAAGDRTAAPDGNDEATEERSIEAGPEWAPPIIQTNGVAQSFVEPTAPMAAPIKGPSGWLSKLAPVVSFTARFTDGAAQTAEASPAAIAAEQSSAAPRARQMPLPLAEPPAAPAPAPARSSPLAETLFPASDSFRFDASVLPAGEPEKEESATAPVDTAAHDSASVSASGHEPAPHADAATHEALDSGTAPAETDLAMSIAEAVPEASEASPAEDAEPQEDSSAAAEAGYADSLMAALEREISLPWPDAQEGESRDAAGPQESAHDEAPAAHIAAQEPMHAEPAPQPAVPVSAEGQEIVVPPPAKPRGEEAVSMAALEAAIESFRTNALDEIGPVKATVDAEAMIAAPVEEEREEPVALSEAAPPETAPESEPAAEAPRPPEPVVAQEPAGPRIAGGTPTRTARRIAPAAPANGRMPARPAARQTPLELDLAAIPDRWLDDVLFDTKPRPKPAPEPSADAGAANGSVPQDEIPSAAQTDETMPARAEAAAGQDELTVAEAAAVEVKATTLADAATTQNARAALVAAAVARVALKANAAAQAVAGGTARQGGAAPQLRRPVPPPLSPQFGARGFRAERPNGNGRAPGGRVDQPAAGAAPAPRKDNDPLAPIMALSEEERIALFS